MRIPSSAGTQAAERSRLCRGSLVPVALRAAGLEPFGVQCMSFRHVIALAVLLSAGSLAAQESTAPAAPAPAGAPAATSAAPLKPGDATTGQGKASVCAACHGLDGNPASSQYPKLAGQHESYVARQIELFKSNKRVSPVMMAFIGTLNAQDMH